MKKPMAAALANPEFDRLREMIREAAPDLTQKALAGILIGPCIHQPSDFGAGLGMGKMIVVRQGEYDLEVKLTIAANLHRDSETD